MKWTQVFCLLAIALSGVASAGEFDGDAPVAPTLPGGPAPILDNDSYQATQGVATGGAIMQDEHAVPIPHGAYQEGAYHPQPTRECMHCNGGLHQCCEHEPSCCDNVWANYCAEKIDWCHRGRRRLRDSLFSRFENDCCCRTGNCNCRLGDGPLQARLKSLRSNRGCATCGNAGCGGGCSAKTNCAAPTCAAPQCGCAQTTDPVGKPVPHYHAPPAPVPHEHSPTPTPATPGGVAPSPDFSTPPAAPVIEPAPTVVPDEPPMIDPEPEAPRSARRAPLQFEDAFQNILRWKQR